MNNEEDPHKKLMRLLDEQKEDRERFDNNLFYTILILWVALIGFVVYLGIKWLFF